MLVPWRSMEGYSGDSWMYPYQRTPMGNPYISPISRGYLWVSYPQESQGWTLAKYHGNHTYVNGVHNNCPLSYMFDSVFFITIGSGNRRFRPTCAQLGLQFTEAWSYHSWVDEGVGRGRKRWKKIDSFHRICINVYTILNIYIHDNIYYF